MGPDPSEQKSPVIQVLADSQGGPYGFYMGSRAAKPACASADDIWVISNPSSDAAKAMLSLVLTAYASGKPVFVHGKGACDPVSTTREAVDYIIAE